VDILAQFTEAKVQRFFNNLPNEFYADEHDAVNALRLGRPFNVIHMPTAFKFDLFPASAFPLGNQELDRAISLTGTGLSEASAPFVTREDILLAKLHWYRLGGEVSEMQWRDVQGLVRTGAGTLDHEYLRDNAAVLNVRDLLDKLFDDSSLTE
jgi:hypothetical protein